MTEYTISIVGNPNCGKTTLFNALTGARQCVGNWPGVTVDKRSGYYCYHNTSVEVVDLPGTYCLDVIDKNVSLDESIARDYILNGEADLIVNIVDASNIERNLYLTTQLMDMGIPIVVVLNMMDVATKKGLNIHTKVLAQKLGCPVLPIVASQAKGIADLQQQLDTFLRNGLKTPQPIPLSHPLEQALQSLNPILQKSMSSSTSLRWHAIKLLEDDADTALTHASVIQQEASMLRRKIEVEQGEEIDILLANDRYNVIGNILKQAVFRVDTQKHSTTDRIDRIVLNRLLGFPIFLGVMYLMFMCAINLGGAFIDFFDILAKTLFVDGSRHLLEMVSAPPWLIAVVSNGFGGGLQTVATFIPVISFLFLVLSFLEGSGYMARAAFVVDRLMRFIGLPGKAFVPMLVGFGCNVPSIMATRTLESPKDRLLTIAMSPFMSCGARLPVYVLFTTAFFPHSGQNIVFLLYMVGIIVAVLTGFLLKKSLLIGESSPLIMELPNYHVPTARQLLLRTWDRLKGFVIKAGKAIVIVVMILNFLNSVNSQGTFEVNDNHPSVLVKIGQFITPMFQPMGISEENWPATVGIFTGILAKEVVVGTLKSMYASINSEGTSVPDVNDSESFRLMAGVKEAAATVPNNFMGFIEKLSDPLGITMAQKDAMEEGSSGDKLTTTLTQLFTSDAAVIAYLLFILLYTPCVSVIGAVYRETNIRWAVFVALWGLWVGYSTAVLYYQCSQIREQPMVSLFWILSMCTGHLLVFYGLKYFKFQNNKNDQGGNGIKPLYPKKEYSCS